MYNKGFEMGYISSSGRMGKKSFLCMVWCTYRYFNSINFKDMFL